MLWRWGLLVRRYPWFRLSVLFTLLFIATFTYVILESSRFPAGARLFPYYIGVVGLVIAIVELVRELFLERPNDRDDIWDGRYAADLAVDPDDKPRESYLGALKYFGWIGGYYLLIWLIGLLGATGLFVWALLRLQFGVGYRGALVSALAAVGLAFGLSEVLNLYWPQSVLRGR